MCEQFDPKVEAAFNAHEKMQRDIAQAAEEQQTMIPDGPGFDDHRKKMRRFFQED